MEITLMPSDSYDNPYERGMDIDIMEVEAGEQFTISNQFEYGSVSFDEQEYKLHAGQDDIDEMDLQDDGIILYPGKYVLQPDGITIKYLGLQNSDSH